MFILIRWIYRAVRQVKFIQSILCFVFWTEARGTEKRRPCERALCHSVFAMVMFSDLFMNNKISTGCKSTTEDLKTAIPTTTQLYAMTQRQVEVKCRKWAANNILKTCSLFTKCGVMCVGREGSLRILLCFYGTA